VTADTEVLTAARRLAEALKPGALDETLAGVTALAVEVLPQVDHASITVRYDSGLLATEAPTDRSILSLDAAQYELREGPCYESATDSVHVSAPFLAHDDRFPRYGPVAVAAGIQAQAAIRLFDAPGSSGALNLYSHEAGSFQDLGVLHELFAHHSATALAYAREVSHLQEAVRTRQVIGQAVGVVMERFGLDEARAFGFLARLSQDRNVKLRVVAERMLAANAEPEER
jgi:hypothetical protein